MFTSAQNFALVQTELDKVFFQEFDFEMGPGYAGATTPELFKQETTDRASEISETFFGTGSFSQISESQNIPLSTPRVKNKKTTLIADFANGVEISKNLYDDDQHGTINRMIRNMAENARYTMHSNAMGVYRGAFTTTLTADGVSLINAAHPTSVGTVSNLITGALSPTTLDNAMVALAEQKDNAGLIKGQQGAVLLVPPALLAYARQITDSQLQADTANNNINVWRSTFGYQVLSSPYLGAAAGGSDTAWFLIGRNHSITRYVRQGIQTNLRDWTFSNNRTYFYQANFREEADVIDYAGIVGSTGL